MNRSIFRQVALERLSTPEQLDQLMPVTPARSWLALLALAGLIVAVIIWSLTSTLVLSPIETGSSTTDARPCACATTPAPTPSAGLAQHPIDLVIPSR